jgi:hypothetical protein
MMSIPKRFRLDWQHICKAIANTTFTGETFPKDEIKNKKNSNMK